MEDSVQEIYFNHRYNIVVDKNSFTPLGLKTTVTGLYIIRIIKSRFHYIMQ